MKAWAVVQDGPNASGWIGNVFHAESSAMRWVEKGNDDMRVIEIEIPDPPPHEWKRGGWFTWSGQSTPIRICDIAGGNVSVIFRAADGSARSDYWIVDNLAAATPCDPPDWWEAVR